MFVQGHKRLAPPVLVVLALLLTGCGAASSLNPFQQSETPPLPGERVSVLRTQDNIAVDERASGQSISLPAEQRNESWTQPGGTPANAPGHLALSGNLRTAWQASAGRAPTTSAGWLGLRSGGSAGRLIAKPVVYQGRVYVLDAEGQVSAFSASGGSRAWRASLVPERERARAGYGGGLAIGDGRLYAATGFGTVVALNPANGSVLWETKVGEPIRTSPTAADGNVYVVTAESELYVLSGEDGEQRWRFRATPESATLLSNASPAVSGDTLVVPFISGELVAFRRSDRQPIWMDSLAGARQATASPLASLNAPSRPVIDGGAVFASSHSGRTIANSLSSGERLWTQSVGSAQTPAVAGDTVYVVDVNNRLVALTRDGGRTRWVAELPDEGGWSGPLLAGGRLWVVSNKGLLLGVDARNGEIGTRRELGTGVDIAPIAAGGRMYIYADNAQLMALD